MNLFGQFFGIPTDTKNTTMGQTDNGQGLDVDTSRQLISRGYNILKELIENSAAEDWLKPVDTPFLARFRESGCLLTFFFITRIMPVRYP